MADLPDWYSQVVSEAVEASSLQGGADSAKSASPISKQIYLATDTKKLYICVADGSWTGFDASILVQGILTLYENLVGNSKRITGIADPTADQDAVTKAFLVAQLASYLALAGGTMTGAIAMGSNKITGLGAPTADDDAARKVDIDDVDDKFSDFSVTDCTLTRAISTVYTNGSKFRIVMVDTDDSSSDGNQIVYMDASAGTTRRFSHHVYAGNHVKAFFIVPPNWKYQVGAPTGSQVYDWHEIDLF